MIEMILVLGLFFICIIQMVVWGLKIGIKGYKLIGMTIQDDPLSIKNYGKGVSLIVLGLLVGWICPVIFFEWPHIAGHFFSN